MHYHDFAKLLLLGTSLEDKLTKPTGLIYDQCNIDFEIPINPGRVQKLEFDNRKINFPKKGSFHLEEKRALSIHFFANHELLAIEMMACALLIYPVKNEADLLFKKGLVKTIIDEQKHLKLYLQRMKEFGLEFGDYPLNDFFWKQMKGLTTPTRFYSLMALTFESANLDFALFYEDCFKEVEDEKSANVMKIVYEDEISHVALGVHWLNQWRNDKNLWEYFSENLPEKMTPARSKGINFNRDSRIRSGLEIDFVDNLEKYYDDFGITNRKNW
jgi:uncharacterized ferritin-like protein (DUF455 family)